MQLVTCAGPLAAGLPSPQIDGIVSFVRPARPGESAMMGRCPSCPGTGMRTFRYGGLRCLSSCPTCAGSGIAEGVFLARAVGDENSACVAALIDWAHHNHVHADVQMLVRDERGPGWSLSWCGVDDRPLRRWRGQPVAHHALGIFVDAIADSVDGHIAVHAATVHGRVAVVGLWDFSLSPNGRLHRQWASREGRSLARRWRVRFPETLAFEALRRVIDPAMQHEHRQPERRGRLLATVPSAATTLAAAACAPAN